MFSLSKSYVLKCVLGASALIFAATGCGGSNQTSTETKAPDTAQQTQMQMDSIRNNPSIPADKKQQMLQQMQQSAGATAK